MSVGPSIASCRLSWVRNSKDYTQQGRATGLSQAPETQRRGREVEWKCPCQGGYRGLGLGRRSSTSSSPPSWDEREGDEGKSDNGVTTFSIIAGKTQRSACCRPRVSLPLLDRISFALSTSY